jgi:hypothetical protein
MSTMAPAVAVSMDVPSLSARPKHRGGTNGSSCTRRRWAVEVQETRQQRIHVLERGREQLSSHCRKTLAYCGW